MSPRDWRLRVQDILEAIAAIQGYTAGMEYSVFTRDRRTVDAVLRNITVIGEAASRIPEAIQAASPDIPWADMRDMRNIVVPYPSVDDLSTARFTWPSFLVSSVLFGAPHGRWLAGTIAGMFYAWALYRWGRVDDAILARAITNALLAADVLILGHWELWG